PDPEDGGQADAFVGSDADYPANGLPQRRKTEFHWLGTWAREADLDRFLQSPATYLPQLAEAKAVCALKLVPYLRRGAGILPSDVHPIRPRPDEPVVVVTSIGTYASEPDAIAASQVAAMSRKSLSDADGLLHELLLLPFSPAALDLF